MWPPARGIEEAFGKQPSCYSFFDKTLGSIRQAVLDLVEFLDSDEGGPFDGIIGFSQGGALAATFLAAEARGLFPSPRNPSTSTSTSSSSRSSRLRCAIFLSCGQPWDLAALEAGQERRLDAESDGICIRIPTAHFWGRNDPEGFVGNHDAALLCDEESRVEFAHMSGHGIPTGARPEELDAVVKGIETTVQRALLAENC